MVRINNSFDGATSSRVLDAYTRNLHDYRVAIELPSLSIVSFLLSRKENPIIVPTNEFESIRNFLNYLSDIYFKPRVNFVCNEDINHPLFYYRQELNLISKLIYHSKKSYTYSLGDVIDFYLDNNLPLNNLSIPQNVVYACDIAVKEFHKKIPEEFNKSNKQYYIAKSNYQIESGIEIADEFKNPQNLYLKLLEDIVEKGVNYLVLQLYDYLIEETNERETPLVIKSNKLISIWDEVCDVSQRQKCKPNINKKIILLPLKKDKIKNRDDVFDYLMEEWSANIARAIELKIRLGIDFVNYLNTAQDTRLTENYNNHVYPHLNTLGLFVQKRIGNDSVIRQKRFNL